MPEEPKQTNPHIKSAPAQATRWSMDLYYFHCRRIRHWGWWDVLADWSASQCPAQQYAAD